MAKKMMLHQAVDHLNHQTKHDPYTGKFAPGSVGGESKKSGGLLGGIKNFIGSAKKEIERQKGISRMEKAGVRHNAYPFEHLEDPEGRAKRVKGGLKRLAKKEGGL